MSPWGRCAAVCWALAAVSGLGTVVVGAVEGQPESVTGGAKQPPVVLISIDTLRADRLPAYGYEGVATPAIDRLRRDGLLVERAYSHAPLTLPSHVSLLSGRLPDDHGVRDNQGYPVDPGEGPYLPRDLAARGYATGGAVSAFVLHRSSGVALGFEFYDDAVEVRDGVALGGQARPGGATLEAIEPWLREVAGKGPFFLFFHLFEPHSPYDPPEPFASRVAHPYDGEIAAADQVVGRLLALLRQLRVYEEALVVLFSDHGEGLGDHGEEEHGLFLYREVLEVPLMIKLPGGERAGGTVPGPAQLVDLYPTIYDVLGLEIPAEMAGEMVGTSLLRLEDTERPLYAETFYPRLRFGWSELRSVISGRWHLIDGPDPELFDLVEDPAEKKNLVSRARSTAETLGRYLAQHRSALVPPSAVDPDVRARLAALGYLGGTVQVPAGPLPDPKAQLPTLEALRAARRHLDAGDSMAALNAYRRVLRDHPRLLDGWIALSGLLRREGRLAEALQAQRRALEVSGGDPHLLPEIALLEAELGQVEQARAALATADAVGIPVVEVRLRLARLLARDGHFAAAAAELEPLAAQEHPAAMTTLARVRSEAGDQGTAQSLLLRSLDLDPTQARAHECLGLVALRRGDWNSARTSSERALALDGGRPEAWNNLGVARFQLGERAAALEAWQRAVELDPELHDTLYNLGTRALELGRLDIARDALQRFAAGAPSERYAEELRRVRVLLRRFQE